MVDLTGTRKRMLTSNEFDIFDVDVDVVHYAGSHSINNTQLGEYDYALGNDHSRKRQLLNIDSSPLS